MLTAVLAGAAVLSLALLLWWRRRPRALPLDRIEIPCASCWRPTAFGALAGGRCLDCRLAPFYADIAAHAHEPPRPAYDMPAQLPASRPRRQASRACLDAHCRVARVVEIMAHDRPSIQLVPPSQICCDCGATLPPRHPWASCTACMSARLTAAYLARTTRRQLTVSEDELRRIWDRVAW